jgi:hypothetical protein
MRAPALIALAVLVGCSNPERASMTINAVAPNGDDTWWNPPQPIWRFVITNTGDRQVVWHSTVDVKGADDRDFSNAAGHIDWPRGVLGPGGSVVKNMIVPAKTGSVWRASIRFWPISNQDLTNAQQDVKNAQGDLVERPGRLSVVDFLPRRPAGRMGEYNDEWHH